MPFSIPFLFAIGCSIWYKTISQTIHQFIFTLFILTEFSKIMKYLTNHFSCHGPLRAKNAQAAARLNDDAYLINANEPPGATDPSTTIRWRKLATNRNADDGMRSLQHGRVTSCSGERSIFETRRLWLSGKIFVWLQICAWSFATIMRCC